MKKSQRIKPVYKNINILNSSSFYINVVSAQKTTDSLSPNKESAATLLIKWESRIQGLTNLLFKSQ